MRRFKGRRVRALLVGVVLATLCASALAYWSAIGTGTASVKLADPLPVTLSPGIVSDPLSPGDVAGVNMVVSNPNPSQEHIGSFTLDSDSTSPAITVDGGHSGCAVSALTFTTQTNGGRGWDVPPKVGASSGTLTLQLTDALAMSAAAANACQGATFTITLDANP